MPASEAGQPEKIRTSLPTTDAGGIGPVFVAVLALAHALLFILAFPPVNFWPLAFIAPAPLAWLAVRTRSIRSTVLIILPVVWLMWLWLQRWMIDVTLPGWPLLAMYLSLYAGGFVWLLQRMSRHPKLSAVPMAVALPVVWVGFECLRGELLFDGYSWFLLAHPLVEWPVVAQSADLLGTYFVSFLAAAVAGAIVDVLKAWRIGATGRGALVSIVLALVVLGANLAYGWWRIAQRDQIRAGPKILLIQTNLPQSNKIAWDLEAQKQDVASFIELTREAFEATDRAADLIVWPETMLPVRGLDPEILQTLLDWRQQSELGFAVDVIRLSEMLATPMLVGSPCYLGLDVSEEGRWIWATHYNSAYLVDGDPPYQRYDKVYLTPMGEVMPYISNWPWLEQKLLGIGAPGMSFSLDSNPDIQRLHLRNVEPAVALATPICFEDTVARVCRRMVYEGGRKHVDVFVNLSNDGWFGGFDPGREQHSQIARFRCIENRVPMVRCANTGTSVWIDSRGYLVGRIGAGRYGEGRRTGWLAADVELDDRVTLYGRVGEIWPWMCLLLGLLATAWVIIQRRAERKET